MLGVLGLAAYAAPASLTVGDPDALSIRPGLLVNPRAVSNLDEEPSLQLSLQRVRPLLRGTILGPTASYFVQAELVGDAPRLLDAIVDVRPVEGLEVSAGRFLVPFTRTQLTPVPLLQFQNFSNSANNERHDRDVGVQVRAFPLDGRLDARVGLFQGPTTDPNDPHPVAFGHVSFDLLGRVPLNETDAATAPDGDDGLSVGAGGSAGTDVRARDGAILETTAGGLDVAARVGPARLQAELLGRRWSDGVRELGGYAQASVAPLPELELAGRVDDLSVDGVDTWTAQGLVSWYADGNHLRLSLEYSRVMPEGQPPSNALGLQQQLWF